jgi:hypothetical protein
MPNRAPTTSPGDAENQSPLRLPKRIRIRLDKQQRAHTEKLAELTDETLKYEALAKKHRQQLRREVRRSKVQGRPTSAPLSCLRIGQLNGVGVSDNGAPPFIASPTRRGQWRCTARDVSSYPKEDDAAGAPRVWRGGGSSSRAEALRVRRLLQEQQEIADDDASGVRRASRPQRSRFTPALSDMPFGRVVRRSRRLRGKDDGENVRGRGTRRWVQNEVFDPLAESERKRMSRVGDRVCTFAPRLKQTYDAVEYRARVDEKLGDNFLERQLDDVRRRRDAAEDALLDEEEDLYYNDVARLASESDDDRAVDSESDVDSDDSRDSDDSESLEWRRQRKKERRFTSFLERQAADDERRKINRDMKVLQQRADEYNEECNQFKPRTHDFGERSDKEKL